MKTQLAHITQIVLNRFNKDLSVYDESFLNQVISTRISATFSESQAAYAALLETSHDEGLHLVETLTNAYSEFFRNPLTFAMLEQFVIPKLVNDNHNQVSGEVRLWSAGCAAGQEPYSLAMLIDFYQKNHHTKTSFRIFATDDSPKQLEAAQNAMYDAKNLQNTRLCFLEKYFTPSENKYKVDDSIKNQVTFSPYNLLRPESSAPPESIFGDFDLIMCSNVLFYYRPALRKLILAKFYRSLKSGGFFITGEAEVSIVKSCTEFRQYAPPAAIFSKI